MLDYIKSLGDDRRNLVRAFVFVVLIIMLVQDCTGFKFCAFMLCIYELLNAGLKITFAISGYLLRLAVFFHPVTQSLAWLLMLAFSFLSWKHDYIWISVITTTSVAVSVMASAIAGYKIFECGNRSYLYENSQDE